MRPVYSAGSGIVGVSAAAAARASAYCFRALSASQISDRVSFPRKSSGPQRDFRRNRRPPRPPGAVGLATNQEINRPRHLPVRRVAGLFRGGVGQNSSPGSRTFSKITVPVADLTRTQAGRTANITTPGSASSDNLWRLRSLRLRRRGIRAQIRKLARCSFAGHTRHIARPLFGRPNRG